MAHTVWRIAALASTLLATVDRTARCQRSGVADSVDRYLTTRTAMGAFTGAVLIARNGTVLLRKGYGYSNVEERIPYEPETQHAVASVSKMFTAMAALKLRDAGKLRLDDPICKYLDPCPEAWRPITIQELMRHTSGIPDYEEALGLGSDRYLAFMTQPNASARILENARRLPLDFPPGEKFHYSNTGYIVLSFIIERAAGMPFADYVTRTILRPAGMTSSGVLGAQSPARLARGYTQANLSWTERLAGVPLTAGHLKRVPTLPLTPPEGDAWLYTTVDDLYRWSRLMEGSELIPKAEVAEVLTPGLENYGYGWFVGTGFDRPRNRHNGELPGYLSDFVRFPEEKITIIVLCNLDRAPLSRIVRDVSAIVLGTPWDPPIQGKVITLSEAQRAPLVGEYRLSDDQILSIESVHDTVFAAVKGRYRVPLIPLSPTRFYFPLGDGLAIFTLGSRGSATKVTLRYSGEDHDAPRR